MKIKKKSWAYLVFQMQILDQQPNADDLFTFIFHYKPQITSMVTSCLLVSNYYFRNTLSTSTWLLWSRSFHKIFALIVQITSKWQTVNVCKRCFCTITNQGQNTTLISSTRHAKRLRMKHRSHKQFSFATISKHHK